MPMFTPVVSGDGFTRLLLQMPDRLKPANVTMASPPTVSTSTTGTTIASGRAIPIFTNGDASYPYGGPTANPIVSAVGAALDGTTMTVNAAGTTFQDQTLHYMLDFDGTSIEFENQSAGGTYWLKVNDEYIDPAGTTLAADAVVRQVKLLFAARTQCRIEWCSYKLGVGKIYVDATAQVTPAQVRGPGRVALVGDSFLGYNPWRVMRDMLGWDDIWCMGMGGTGVIATNAGANQSFEQRWTRDVVARAPAVAWVVGSVNDDTSAAADVAAALLRMRAAYLAAVPTGFFIWSPNALGGPNRWTTNKNLIRVAVKAALAGLAQTYVVDPLEQPLQKLPGTAAPSDTLYAAASIGATTIALYGTAQTGGYPANGAILQIDDERVEVKTSAFGGTGAGGKYRWNCTIDGALLQAHAAGATWTVVGASYITGSGSAGNPTGYGSADAYRISNADIHPTAAGANAYGKALANGLAAAI